MKWTTQLSAIALLFASFQRAAVPQAPNLDTVFTQMEKANKDYNYLQGNIEKYLYTDFINKLQLNGSGKIWISSAGSSARRVKVEFDKPAKEQLSLDNGLFIDYFPGTKSGKKIVFDKEKQPEAECIFLGLCGSTTLLKQNYV